MSRALKNIFVIIRLTTLELVRSRILMGLFIFAMLMMGAGSFFTYFTFGEEIKIIMDIGLSTILLIGLASGIFSSVWTFNEDIENKTIYVTLSYPISRFQIIIGKYIATVFIILLNILFMSLMFFLLVYLKLQDSPQGDYGAYVLLAKSILLIFAECSLAASMVLCFSVIFTPIVSIVLFITVFILGHVAVLLGPFAAKLQALGYVCVRVLYVLIPGFASFNIRDMAVLGVNVSWPYIGTVLLYGLMYVLFMLSLAVYTFERREIR